MSDYAVLRLTLRGKQTLARHLTSLSSTRVWQMTASRWWVWDILWIFNDKITTEIGDANNLIHIMNIIIAMLIKNPIFKGTPPTVWSCETHTQSFFENPHFLDTDVLGVSNLILWYLSISLIDCVATLFPYHMINYEFTSVAAVKSRPVLHHCVVIFFWSSGIMECTCMLFTFENGVLLMR